MSKQTVIVSGGMVEKDFALSILKSEETEFVIGVDRGLVFLYDNEIKPDYIVGDFDSVPRKLVEYYREELDVPVREFNPVKDASDTEIALRLCLGLNRKKIVILGATGNRIDHLWANVQCLQIALEAGADACIMDAHNKIRLLDKTVTLKKEEISNLQNGKAGNVYIISNLGSFGRNIFKIGMTRRLDPQDRVNELGSASVPFKFDVHSFIFSDDAVALENKLHQLLNEKRVNKVNLRKEFFYTSVKELEQIVADIDPTAEFKKTMVAEEFRQSQNNVIYKSIPQPEDSSSDLDDEDEDENE